METLTYNETGQLVQLVRRRMQEPCHSPVTMPQLESIEAKLMQWLNNGAHEATNSSTDEA